MNERLVAALADRYRIERELGQGGMATVYLAHDIKHDRDVAIKVLREDLAASMGASRFLREIQIAAQLQHPHILPLLDSGEADGFLYYVMPYVTGQSLRERLAREGELPVHEAVRLLSEIVDALAHAHEHGVVHRDIKPDNVMLSGRHALVADFGVAKAVSEATGRSTITTLGVAVGTPAYMSPEQAAADPHIDQRSDIYAVGAMAYELLTGRPPFVGATPQQVLAAHVTEAPDPVTKRRPGIPAQLDQLIMRCLAKRPADRWQNAGDLLAALEPLSTPSGGVTPTHTRPIPAVAARHPSKAILLTAAIFVVVVGLAWWNLGRHGAGGGATKAIAVLPFDNVGRDTAFDYLAEGIANDVRGGLMSLPGVSVKARTSSEAARGKSIRDAGHLLNVGVILQGTFRRTADKITVAVDLVKVDDESALWSGSFVLPASGDFTAGQDSITRAVAKTLHLGAASQAVSAEVQRGTKNNEAYDQYLKGQYFFIKRGGENIQRAIEYFTKAIAIDPQFARARAALAMVYTVLPSYMAVASSDSFITEAQRIAREALAIDSTLAEAHLALANSLNAQLHWQEAEPEYAAALRLDPRNATAHQWHGDNLAFLGRFDESLKEGHAAIDLDPLSAVAYNDLSYNLLNAGRPVDAVQVGRRAVELDSTMVFVNVYLALGYAFSGRPDSARRAFDRAFRIDSTAPETRAYHVWSYALAGDWANADREAAAVRVGSRTDAGLLDLAIADAAMGKNDEALDLIARGATARNFYIAVTMFGCDPTFYRLRSDPRLVAAARTAGQFVCDNQLKWPIPARKP